MEEPSGQPNTGGGSSNTRARAPSNKIPKKSTRRNAIGAGRKRRQYITIVTKLKNVILVSIDPSHSEHR